MLPCHIRRHTRSQHEGNISSRVAAVEPKQAARPRLCFWETSPKALVKSPEGTNTHRLIWGSMGFVEWVQRPKGHLWAQRCQCLLLPGAYTVYGAANAMWGGTSSQHLLGGGGRGSSRPSLRLRTFPPGCAFSVTVVLWRMRRKLAMNY